MKTKTLPSVPGRLVLFWLSLPGIIPSIALAQPELQVGYGVFDAGSTGGAPSIAALFRLENPDGILISEAGVGAAKTISEGRIFVQQDSTRTTGLAMVNRSDHPEIVQLVLRDSTGTVAASRQVPLVPGEHRARFVSELLPGIPSSFLGSLTFRTSSGQATIAAVTLRQSTNSRGEPVFTTLPVAELAADGGQQASAQLVMPEIGAGPGLSTQLALISRSASVSRGMIRLFDADGHPLRLVRNGETDSEFPFALAGEGVLFAEFNSPDPGAVGVGYAVVTVEAGSVLPAGSAVFRYTDGQGIVISEAGVGACAGTTRARVLVDQYRTRTGLAMANPGEGANPVDFTLLDANGGQLASTSFTLPADGHLSIFADELFQLGEGFSGMLEIESQYPVTPITVKLTMNGRNQPILTTLPVSDLASPNLSEVQVVPQMGFGRSPIGDFSTRLVFLSSRTDAVSVGGLDFRVGEGAAWGFEELPSQFQFAVGPGELGILPFETEPEALVIARGESASAVIDATGGSITIENSQGVHVELRIPPFALFQPETITVTLLTQSPRHSFTGSVFPGVVLEPAGLALNRPARLQFRLPAAVGHPEFTSLVWLATSTHAVPIGNQTILDDSIEGDILHFSAFSWEGLTLSEAMRWINIIPGLTLAELGPDYVPLPPPIAEALDALSTLDAVAQFNRLQDLVGTEDLVGYTESVLGPLEQIALGLLSQPAPADSCGLYHSYLRMLAGAFAILGDEDIDRLLTQRISSLDHQCIEIDLTGSWAIRVADQMERCRIVSGCRGGFCTWDEQEDDFWVEAAVVQNGSSFETSFPDFPEAGTFTGSLQATGAPIQPYFFDVSNSGDSTPDCQAFFEWTDFGSPICNPQFAPCVPLACHETDILTAGVSPDGDLFLGLDSWDFLGEVRETRQACNTGGSCWLYTVVVKYRCQGSAQLSGQKLD